MLLLPAILLDAAMTVSAALARLARHGLWRKATDPGAKEWIEEQARRTSCTPDVAAGRLRRDPSSLQVAIRRQWGASVLWYARPVDVVLDECLAQPPEATVRDALQLHESDSRPPLPLPAPGEEPKQEGVVLDGDRVVAVNVAAPPRATPRARGNGGRAPGLESLPDTGGEPATAADDAPPAPAPQQPRVEAWPRLDAPPFVPARREFQVTVGFAREQQAGVSGAKVVIEVPSGTDHVVVDVDLLADGVDALDGWRRRMRVPVNDPTSAEVAFRLVGREPSGGESVHLTTLEVRYVHEGAICGTAARPLVIGLPSATAVEPPSGPGTPWLSQPQSASPVTVARDDLVPDLTIEIAKPDGNAASGRYDCRLYSPHPLSVATGPHAIDLGQDAKTFARAVVVDELHRYQSDPLADNALRAIGSLVAEQLPGAAFDALREVAARVAPQPPAVLVVSAEPYVPWELAVVDPPLDPARPPYLGAQALVGRWLRDRGAPQPSSTASGGTPRPPQRPPPHPPARIPVRHMAVMAGMYRSGSGLQALPNAQQEAKSLVQQYGAIPLSASRQALKQLLDGVLTHQFTAVGAAELVHFAGHGQFDPTLPDASVLYLDDGTPLSSFLFRSARCCEKQQALLFLNACMIGIGGELLGDMGGFPGNCLKGGFGGVLGALWEVDDKVAAEVAIEFWRRALPPKGSGAQPEPVGAILRDLRGKYVAATPETTYLAYVYYGHPRLTLGAA